ncbi:MAG: two-component response regulator [Verrucomicrobiales bacterium]|nr:two-component response regulator [Verrucomicrobiales bacterium]
MTTQSQPLVAIVDDNQSVRIATDGLMRSVGYRTENFASAEEFLAKERLEEIGCVILDLKLNGMDGLALQSRLVAANLQIPIIFITAHWDEPTRTQALRLGAVDFLRKPCSAAALLEALQEALESSRIHGAFEAASTVNPLVELWR